MRQKAHRKTHMKVKAIFSGILLSSLMLASTAQADRTTTYTYTTLGQIDTIDGPLPGTSDTTDIDYDAQGNITQISNALAQVTGFTSYDNSGRLLTSVDANGLTTTLTYDLRGRLSTRTIGNALTKLDYDAAGNLTKVTAPDGTHASYVYDIANRLIRIENSSGGRIDYTLDDMGNRLSETISEVSNNIAVQLKAQSQLYDELGRLIHQLDSQNHTVSSEYDNNGNLIKSIDAKGQDTDFGFDPLDQLTTMTDFLNGVTTYEYDDQGNRTAVTDPAGNRTTFDYNAYSEVTERDSPDTGITTYTYDDAGNLLTKTDARSIVTTYTYDLLNRVKTVSYSNNTSEDLVYAYDSCINGIGRLCLVSRAGDNSSTAYQYDVSGNITQLTETINGTAYSISYQYNDANQRIAMTLPSGRLISYTYGNQGQIGSLFVRDTPSSTPYLLANNISYQQFGGINNIHFANGLSQLFNYDQDYQIDSIVTQVDANNTLSEWFYNYDLNNNISDITDGISTSRSLDFDYDELDRLIQGIGSYGQIDFQYDANGNRTSKTDVNSFIYTTDTNSNQLSQITNTSIIPNETEMLSYSDVGNLASKTANAITTTYTNNQANRLVQISDTTDTNSYVYNAQGQRTSKTTNAGSVHYLYDLNGQMIAEIDPTTGNHIREYVYLEDRPLALFQPPPPSRAIGGNSTGPDCTGQTQVDLSNLTFSDPSYECTTAVAITTDTGGFVQNTNTQVTLSAPQITLSAGTSIALGATFTAGQPSGTLPSNGLYYYHTDHLGTPRYLTDAQQNIVWDADFKPFGEVNILTNSIDNNLRFPGQYFDQETGQHYNYFRDYAPELGRYIQSDPIGLSGGVNTYAYVLGNPMRYTDPLGLATSGQWKDCGGGCQIRIEDNHFGSGRHIHWKCQRGKIQGSCGEFGTVSHGSSCGSMPNKVKKCARKHGFEPDPAFDPKPQEFCGENCQQVLKTTVDAVTGAILLIWVVICSPVAS